MSVSFCFNIISVPNNPNERIHLRSQEKFAFIRHENSVTKIIKNSQSCWCVDYSASYKE